MNLSPNGHYSFANVVVTNGFQGLYTRSYAFRAIVRSDNRRPKAIKRMAAAYATNAVVGTRVKFCGTRY